MGYDAVSPPLSGENVATTNFDRVMVWKFDSAPEDLRVLSRAGAASHWLAFVPAAMHGPDLELAIRLQVPQSGLEQYRTASGNVIYVGSSDVKQLMELVVSHTSIPDPEGIRDR